MVLLAQRILNNHLLVVFKVLTVLKILIVLLFHRLGQGLISDLAGQGLKLRLFLILQLPSITVNLLRSLFRSEMRLVREMLDLVVAGTYRCIVEHLLLEFLILLADLGASGISLTIYDVVLLLDIHGVLHDVLFIICPFLLNHFFITACCLVNCSVFNGIVIFNDPEILAR